MNIDIAPILRYWEFISNEMEVYRERIGDKEYLKLIYGAGQITMHTKGRPDGARPFFSENYWKYIKTKIARQKQEGKQFRLDEGDIAQLLQEIVLYHARSIAFMKIKEYHKSARDIRRNVHLVDNMLLYIDNKKIKERLNRLKPYLSMTYNKSLVNMSEEKGNGDEALRYTQDSIKILKKKYNLIDISYEILRLEKIRRSLLKKYAHSRFSLEDELKYAVKNENFERAAFLRDRLDYISNN
jgi:valyl-tRNA synthetase